LVSYQWFIEDHPVAYPMGTGTSLAGGKAAVAWSSPRNSV